MSLNNLGFLFHAQGGSDEAKASFQRGVDMQEGLADVLLAATSEAEAMNYLAQLPLNRDGFISVCLHVPDSDEANYARVWHSKAAVARSSSTASGELFKAVPPTPAPAVTSRPGATSAASSPGYCWPPPTVAITPSGLPAPPADRR